MFIYEQDPEIHYSQYQKISDTHEARYVLDHTGKIIGSDVRPILNEGKLEDIVKRIVEGAKNG